MKKSNQVLRVYRGDADNLYFDEGDEYKMSYLRQVFKKKTSCCPHCSWPLELFPGLILEDEEGNLLTPKVQVELMPYKPEETV